MNEINRNNYNGPGLLGIFIVTCISVSMCSGGAGYVSSRSINERLDVIEKKCSEKRP